jgi:hypothetical protein
MHLLNWIVGIFRRKAADGTAPEAPIAGTNAQRKAGLDDEVKLRLGVIDARVNPHNMQ